MWRMGVALCWLEGLGIGNGEGRIRTQVFVVNSKVVKKKNNIYIYTS